MKLSETTFFVRVNKTFMEKLQMKPTQLAWFVMQAAKSLDESLWDQNEKVKDTANFDCWLHDLLFVKTDKRTNKTTQVKMTIEAIPFPKGVLMLGIQGYQDTYPYPPRPGDDVADILYPNTFQELLDKSEEELDIERATLEDGQNKFSV
jgi:hypothetical protein